MTILDTYDAYLISYRIYDTTHTLVTQPDIVYIDVSSNGVRDCDGVTCLDCLFYGFNCSDFCTDDWAMLATYFPTFTASHPELFI